MKEIEIHLAGAKDEERIERVIESACTAQNLKLAAKSSLQKYPGCVHWHYQKADTTGTLEITYWPSQNRCWFPLIEGRAKSWVIEMANIIKIAIEEQIRI
jgi:hypothetical protein